MSFPNQLVSPLENVRDIRRADSDYSMASAKSDLEMGHNLSPMDPDSPMAWPLWKKLYTSATAFAFAFVVVYGTTTYTAAIPAIPKAFGVSMQLAILGFTIPFFGVFFAPIITPHLTERLGRRPIYLTSISLFSLSVIGIGLATNFSVLLAFRFLAGLFGGPCLVLIEGTFADIWSAERTVTYYSFLTVASYVGAACGPIIGNFVFAAQGAAWLAWVTLIFALIAIAFGAAMPETYVREIMRQRIHYTRSNTELPPAQSGVTLSAMARITVFTPIKMLFTEPVVAMISLYVGLNFAVVFQWFVSVPVALGMSHRFTGTEAGLAFLAAVAGAVLALISCIMIEAVSSTTSEQCNLSGITMVPIERRLIPAMFGGVLVAASLFWIGFSVSPNISSKVPIIGTAVYVWGNAMVLIALVSYLFDAYPPAGTLSALTTAACFRILAAGIVPLYILDAITGLPNGWAFGTFGIVSAIMWAFPFVLYKFGPRLRERSKYSQGKLSTVQMEISAVQQNASTTPVQRRPLVASELPAQMVRGPMQQHGGF